MTPHRYKLALARVLERQTTRNRDGDGRRPYNRGALAAAELCLVRGLSQKQAARLISVEPECHLHLTQVQRAIAYLKAASVEIDAERAAKRALTMIKTEVKP